MAILSLKQVSIAFGINHLLDQVDFQIDKGERVCLLGRNGSGKSTLLKIIDGKLAPDSGNIQSINHLKVRQLSQDIPDCDQLSVFDFVAQGLGEVGAILKSYHEVSHQLSTDHSDSLMNQLSQLQNDLDAKDGWLFEQKINDTLSRLKLQPEQLMSALSGGWRRRVALAQALVSKPDLLLLDEPTNHLDIETIDWLEKILLDEAVTLIFISHDRTFVRNVATRIIELDRGCLSSWPGNYEQFLIKKMEQLEIEQRHNELFDKRLAQEEKWIRQGIKARRTRNEGRVKSLEKMREECRQRRNLQGKVNFDIEAARRSGQIVIEASNISFSYQNEKVINDFSIKMMRGDRIGIVGPNGAGKTTLIQLLTGRIKPDEGSIQMGTHLQIAYFDQLRAQLDPEKTVADNVAEGRQEITIGGRQKHIIGYLQDFLFLPERARTPVKALSGGEQNRLLLARIFANPSNLLIFDEPTNDLDVDTLELLEEILIDYKGTLIVVTHDREFLDHVVTQTLVFETQGNIQQYVGGYSDWHTENMESKVAEAKSAKKTALLKSVVVKKNKKLGYKEIRELDELPVLIESLEVDVKNIQNEISDTDFYKQDQNKVQNTIDILKQKQTRLDKAYQRWDELESTRNNAD